MPQLLYERESHNTVHGGFCLPWRRQCAVNEVTLCRSFNFKNDGGDVNPSHMCQDYPSIGASSARCILVCLVCYE